MSLIKSQLIQNITDANPHLFVRDVERIVNTIFNEITNSLAEGNRVELRGFGAFSVQHRKARVGRNPKTGEAVEVEEKFIPRFKTGKELRVKLNSKNNIINNQTIED
tara:strand:+ start:197 stop:517 length:321 start_codon:yes stop_codon:yes gene_type:complete